MKRFTDLLNRIDESREPEQKRTALTRYFLDTPASDCAWALKLLLGESPKRLISPERLKAALLQHFDVPEWLFNECLKVAGDLCETISLVVPETAEISQSSLSLSDWIESRIRPLARQNPESQVSSVLASWEILPGADRLAFNRLVTGTFRSPVSADLVVGAIACAFNLPVHVVWYRLSEVWMPSERFFQGLTSQETGDAEIGSPYPFSTVTSKAGDLLSLGDISAWQAEWKWDGVRAQLVRRGGQSFIWSQSEVLITARFPEIFELSQGLPDGTVLDGEIVAWAGDMPLGRSHVLARMDRKAGVKPIANAAAITFIVFDILEAHGKDVRSNPLRERREALRALLAENLPLLVGRDFEHQGIHPLSSRLPLSARINLIDWSDVRNQCHQARSLGVEGLILKRLDSPYQPLEEFHEWLTLEPERLAVLAVLMYAERGSGSKSTEFVNYTLGVWHDAALVPVAKIGCTLPAEEIAAIDAFIVSNTLERIGPIRTVKPEIVMELHFEGVEPAARRKAGLVLRSPRIGRLLPDHTADSADSLEFLRSIVEEYRVG